MRFLGSLLFLVACFLSSVSCSNSTGWFPLSFSETMLFDVFTTNATTFYSVAESAQAQLYAQVSYDSGTTYRSMELESDAVFLMDIVMGSEQIGITSGIGIAKSPNSYTEDGFIFNRQSEPGLLISHSQGASLIQDSKPYAFALPGLFQFPKHNYNGVSVSYNGGKNYSYIDCGTVSFARYGAFPTSKTWFIGAGQWPSNSDLVSADGKVHLTHRRSVQSKLKGPIPRIEVDMSKAVPHAGAPIPKPNPNGWFAQILRTQDGGASWSSVFVNDTFYPNEMAFSDENNGFFVAAGNAGAFIYATKDGGNTWQDVMFDADCDIMSAWASSPTDWWAGGANLKARVGRYWHSTDAGATWTGVDIPGVDEFVSISMASAHAGYAAAIASNGNCQLYAYNN